MQTAFAARGVLNRLNANFQYMNYLFASFYDFDRGLEEDFKRKLTQVPIQERGKDWVSIMWSRDPKALSYINKPFQLIRDTKIDGKKQIVNGRLVFCSVVFTYISNSRSYLEAFAEDFFDYLPDGFHTQFFNTPFPEWKAKKQITLGAKFISRVFNGYCYECTVAGTTGTSEPKWTSAKVIKDGTAVWTAVDPEKLGILFENVAYSGLQDFSLKEDDTLVKFDIGGRMFYPVLHESIDPNTGLVVVRNPVDPNTGLPINGGSGIAGNSGELVPVIKYPKSDIYAYTDENAEQFLDTVTPTPEHWRQK